MAGEGDKSSDFYAILGLKRECTAAELRVAYKKLALKWHPDRCSASGNLKYEEEAKKKFQTIQEAYSVLSDTNKRFLYDVGVYDSNDDDDENGMGDFLNEMASMMTQNKSQENGNESFEELKDLFDEMFQSDMDAFGMSSSCSSSSQASSNENQNSFSNKRNSVEMSSSAQASPFEGFCMGMAGTSGKHQVGGEGSRRKNTARKVRR